MPGTACLQSLFGAFFIWLKIPKYTEFVNKQNRKFSVFVSNDSLLFPVSKTLMFWWPQVHELFNLKTFEGFDIQNHELPNICRHSQIGAPAPPARARNFFGWFRDKYYIVCGFENQNLRVIFRLEEFKSVGELAATRIYIAWAIGNRSRLKQILIKKKTRKTPFFCFGFCFGPAQKICNTRIQAK
jgi:hypothetical protein